MSGQKDDGQRTSEAVEAFLKFQSAHRGHAYVEHQAARALFVIASEEVFASGEGLAGKVDRFQQRMHGAPDGRVIINNEHRGRRNTGIAHRVEFEQKSAIFANSSQDRTTAHSLCLHSSLVESLVEAQSRCNYSNQREDG